MLVDGLFSAGMNTVSSLKLMLTYPNKEKWTPNYDLSFVNLANDAGFDTVWLGLKRGQLQRNYVWRFIELCNAGLSLEEIKRQAMEPEEAAIDYQI